MTCAVQHHEIETAALRLRWFAVPWDSEAFGFPVAQIDELVIGTGDPAAGFEQFEAWCRDRSVRLASCRLAPDRLRESGWLESRGFRFIEMVYRPRTELSPGDPEPATPVAVSPVTAAELPAVEAIAGSAFTTGRFHLDPALDPHASGRRYGRWVRTSFANPAHEVLKAELDGRLAGFFVTEPGREGTVYWHLTAVAPDMQGRGVGKQIWQAMLARHRRQGARAVETTVSAHNIPVLNLYARLGFRLQAGGMTFHRTAMP
jgi:ribosomal protein S18 acetylase RimI-like enzyme